jgi:hypothetical protein
MKKTNKTKSKPTDLKPKPPIKKPTKPSKARYNQPGRDLKEEARAALKTLQNIAMPMLLMKMHAQLMGNDSVTLPMDLLDAALEVFGAVEENIIVKAGLEDDYEDLDDILSEDEE